MLLSSAAYSEAIKSMPVVCVDLVLRDVSTNQFFLLKRKDEPLKDFFWTPGGRVHTGETLIDAAQRIAEREIGFLEGVCWEGEPAGVYFDQFSASAFGSHLYQTVSFLMNAEFNYPLSKITLGDGTSEGYSFQSELPSRLLAKSIYFEGRKIN